MRQAPETWFQMSKPSEIDCVRQPWVPIPTVPSSFHRGQYTSCGQREIMPNLLPMTLYRPFLHALFVWIARRFRAFCVSAQTPYQSHKDKVSCG